MLIVAKAVICISYDTSLVFWSFFFTTSVFKVLNKLPDVSVHQKLSKQLDVFENSIFFDFLHAFFTFQEIIGHQESAVGMKLSTRLYQTKCFQT